MSYTVKASAQSGAIEYLTGVTGLSVRQVYPGGFESASFEIPGERYFEEFTRLTVSKGPVILFDGEIGDRGLQTAPDGKSTKVTAYGHNVLLTRGPYGPRIFADTRIDKWQLYTAINAPLPTPDHAPDKYGTKQDSRSFRIYAKPGAAFRSLDMETFFYSLPRVAGVYVPESIDQINFDYALNFPTGSWALVAWFWDGSHAAIKQIYPRVAGLFAQAGDPEAPSTAGTVTRVAGQKTLAGTGTTFTADLIGKVIAVNSPAFPLGGTVTKTAGQANLIGSGTSFAAFLQINDLIEVGNEVRRINASPTPTTLSVDTAWGESGSGLTARRQQTAEHRHVVSVTSATALTVDEEWLLSASGQSFQLVTRAGLVTSSQMGLPGGCKAAGFALRSLANQASWPGFADDGAGKSAVHDLEYAGAWYPDYNDSTVKRWHSQGGMTTGDAVGSETATSVTYDKSGGYFWPDGGTRVGGAARLRFTGSKVEWYALKWGSEGNAEVTVWSGTTAIYGPVTLDLYDASTAPGPHPNAPYLYQTKVFDSDFPHSTATTTEALDTTEVGVDVTNGALFTAGQRILIDAEQMDIASIAGNTLTVTRGAGGTVAAAHATGAAVFIFAPIIGQFGEYTLTIRNLGVSTSGPALPLNNCYHTNVDFFKIGIGPLKPFAEGDIYAEISNVRLTTDATASPDAITAETIARDIVASYSRPSIGLSPNGLYINMDAAALPVLDHYAQDDPVTAIEALDAVIAYGTSADEPIGYGVWAYKMLHLSRYPLTGDRARYEVDPRAVEISQDESIQQEFATTVAPTYKDQDGVLQIGADVVTARFRPNSKIRRIILPTDARTATDAAEVARTWLRSHEWPAQQTKIVIRGPLRDQGGAPVPPEEVRAGMLLRIMGYSERGYFSSTDRRGGRDALIVSTDMDLQNGVLTLGLGEEPDEESRLIARLVRDQARERIRG